MKHTVIALIVITLISCKKTPQRIVTENPTPEPIPCKAVFYTPKAVTWMYLTIGDKTYETTEVQTTPSCDKGFIFNSYVGRVINYSYEIGSITGKGTVTLTEGCNQIELK